MENLHLSLEQKKFYHENGFLHIKSVFTPEEVKIFRNAALLESEPDETDLFSIRNPDGAICTVDLLSHCLFKKFILKKEVVSILKELLDDTPVYFGVSTVSINYYKNSIFKHRDIINWNDPNGPDWDGQNTITRIGLYLEDHIDNGGNIWFTPESHKKFLPKKSPQSFHYKAGDLIIWSIMTEHSVSALSRNLLKGKQIPFLLEVLYFRLLKPFLSRKFLTTAYPPEEKPRIFMTAIFAASGDKVHPARMVNTRDNKGWNWKYRIFNNTKFYDKEIFIEAKQKGLDLNLEHILEKKNPYQIIK